MSPEHPIPAQRRSPEQPAEPPSPRSARTGPAPERTTSTNAEPAAQCAEQGGHQPSPAQRMIALGIVQAGDPALRTSARPFDLPREAAAAHDTIALIKAAMDRVAGAHRFAKGMGMAAPQIGIDRAAAVIRTGKQELVLLNPRIVDESADRDTLFEGCLSFFDVRGEVERPVCVEVEHRRPDGTVEITRFAGGPARHVQHEIDHLEGRLYTDRMPAGTDVIPLSEYQGTGRPWREP